MIDIIELDNKSIKEIVKCLKKRNNTADVRRNVEDIIEDIKAQGTTVLLIEQNANKALSIADRGYVLETGKVVLSGTGEELLASDEVRKAYLGG